MASPIKPIPFLSQGRGVLAVAEVVVVVSEVVGVVHAPVLVPVLVVLVLVREVELTVGWYTKPIRHWTNQTR